jgi:hypothetical protein
MTRNSENLQPSLFEPETPRVELQPSHKADLLAVVEALLCEIAAALANGESGDDQDHG